MVWWSSSLALLLWREPGFGGIPIPLLKIISCQEGNSSCGLVIRFEVPATEALHCRQLPEVTTMGGKLKTQPFHSPNPSPWDFWRAGGQLARGSQWFAERCLWFAQCDISLDCVMSQLADDASKTDSLWESTILLRAVLWALRSTFKVQALTPYSSSEAIALLCKYCKTLCFSCLISFRFLFFNRIDLLRSKIYLHIEPRNHESIQENKQVSTPINILTYKTLIVTSKTLKNLLETITTCSYNHYNLYTYKRIASKLP